MDNKFYVSLEAARLLYEKGFKSDLHHTPTKAEAIDWLESNGRVVEIQYNQESNTWSYAIYFIIYTHFNEVFSTRLEAEDAAIIKALMLYHE